MSQPHTTVDDFLGGAVKIEQPQKGYRAGIDPVLLAASVQASGGAQVLELGCGVGVASLCLAHRLPGLVHVGVELQSDYAALACENAARNHVEMEVFAADLRKLPIALRERQFDQVLMNPPYYTSDEGVAPRRAEKSASCHEENGGLGDWIDCAFRRLKDRGCLSLVQRASRLQDVLAGLSHYKFGDIEVRPVQARRQSAAGLILLQCRKLARAELRLLPPLVMHDGDVHLQDGDDFSTIAKQILRDGKAL
jgi:tRNA1(Val) A37 N6-methylase TrmN6